MSAPASVSEGCRELISPHAPDEICRRFRDMVGWPKLSHLDVVGYYDRDGFRLYMNPKGRSSYRPLLCGHMKWDGTRTRISCAMEAPFVAKVFVAAWCVLAFLNVADIVVGLANILEDQPSEQDIAAFQTLGFLVLAAGLVSFWRWQTRHEQHELFDFVEGLLDAQPKSGPTALTANGAEN